MKNQLSKYFFISITCLLILVISYSLFGPKGTTINWKEITFSTNKASLLYFKNMRSFFYNKEIREDANFILYRIDSREIDNSANRLSFVLVSNWLLDECYIMAESDVYNITNLALEWKTEKETRIVNLSSSGTSANYIFAAELYEALTKNATITFSEDNTKLKESEKKSLRKTLNDYFKLVGKIR